LLKAGLVTLGLWAFLLGPVFYFNMSSQSYRINGFEQIKSFYSWVFNNQDKDVNATHVSLYLFLINQNNRANWVEWFKCPYDLGMAGSCIGSRNTYYKVLEELKNWGLIDYQKGINNYKAPKVKLCLFKNEQVTEQVPVPLCEPLSEPLYEQVVIPLCEPLSEHIYKLLTNNLKLITDNIEDILIFLNDKPKSLIKEKELFEIFRLKYPGTKRGLDSEFNDLVKKHKNYKEICLILLKELERQINERSRITGFIPEWPHLKTYLHNNGWETEYKSVEKSKFKKIQDLTYNPSA